MRLSAPIYRLKRKAKQIARSERAPLHIALDRVAAAEGFRSWAALSAAAAARRPAKRVLQSLDPGDMFLVGGRPGHGKTLLALELAALASARGRGAMIFTLDETEAGLRARLAELGLDEAAASVLVDASDDISADHIARRLSEADDGTLVVIDYLQLLDQKRSHPSLDQQVRTLRAVAKARRAIMVVISQIDRAFDAADEATPTLSHIRAPNPFDLGSFDRACFIHDGELRLERIRPIASGGRSPTSAA